MPAHRTRDIQQSARSLEVTTDAPQPPTLAIISPTPRAFTFPINHELHDSPYSSPSASPFEPDLGSLVLTSRNTPPIPAPPTHLIRTLSPPISSSLVAPASSMTHKRRKSACSELERRPKKGDEDYVKRPENAFILFRRKCCEDRQAAHEEAAAADNPTKKQRQADLSKTISQQWKSLPAEERQYWEDLAKEKKKEHEAMYPNYVYRPQRTKESKAKAAGKKADSRGRRGSEAEFETDSESVSFILPFANPLSRLHGRSASAPTPPMGYQQITVPNVYMPSCPTSPSLMPLLRRSSHPGHSTGFTFDYVPPENNLVPTSYHGDYQPPMNPPEFFTNMFDMTGQTEPSLHPLNIDHPLVNPTQQILSPSSSIASGSSGPPSPRSNGRYTPHMYDQGYPADSHQSSEMPLPELVDYPQYQPWAHDLWTTQEGAEMLLTEDFDLNSIPPIQLGETKGNDVENLVYQPEQYHHHQQNEHHPRHDGLQGMFAFEQMMIAQQQQGY